MAEAKIPHKISQAHHENLLKQQRSTSIPHLAQRMQSKNARTRQRAIEKLEALATEEAFQLLLTALNDTNKQVRNRAIQALGYLGDSRALLKLLPLFKDEEEVKALRVSSNKRKEFISVKRRANSVLDLVEAVGRIADSRALPVLTMELLAELTTFEAPIRLSWAIASIAARTNDMAIKQQAARQLIQVFPCEQIANQYILHRMPWPEADMLECVATLLSVPEAETCHQAAVFLNLHGDSRGADMLLESLQHPERVTFGTKFWEYRYTQVLADRADRRLVAVYLNLLNQPSPANYAFEYLYIVLARWAKALTPHERQQFLALAPRILGHLERGDVDPNIILALRLLDSDEVNQLVDRWLDERLYNDLAPFIEGDLSGLPHDFGGNIILRSQIVQTSSNQDLGILTHPVIRRYAFPALRARYEFLQRQNETSVLPFLIATIGWLGDPQALSFLERELARYLQADPDLELTGEIIWAIANIGSPDSVPVLLDCLHSPSPHVKSDTIEPLRDFAKKVHNKEVVQELLTLVEMENVYGSAEIIEAIGKNGNATDVPSLAHFLSHRDENCSASINALISIAQAHSDNLEVVREVVTYLVPLLREERKVPLNDSQPLSTMPLDHFVALALKDINTPEALAAVDLWQTQM